jgi:hypothetical protein
VAAAGRSAAPGPASPADVHMRAAGADACAEDDQNAAGAVMSGRIGARAAAGLAAEAAKHGAGVDADVGAAGAHARSAATGPEASGPGMQGMGNAGAGLETEVDGDRWASWAVIPDR